MAVRSLNPYLRAAHSHQNESWVPPFFPPLWNVNTVSDHAQPHNEGCFLWSNCATVCVYVVKIYHLKKGYFFSKPFLGCIFGNMRGFSQCNWSGLGIREQRFHNCSHPNWLWNNPSLFEGHFSAMRGQQSLKWLITCIFCPNFGDCKGWRAQAFE